MCLYSTKERLIAEEDIVVYKILCELSNIKLHSCSYYRAPYNDMYEYNEGMNYPNGAEDITTEYDYNSCKVKVIHGGFLHAFKTLESARLELQGWHDSEYCKYFITEMVIPKGTAYYDGEGNDVCANALRWEKINKVE